MLLINGMTQLRKAYWRRQRESERAALRSGAAGASFPCAAERFATKRLNLRPTEIWEDEIDAMRGERRYEIRQRREGDRRAFERLDTAKFDILVVCVWTIGEARGVVHLKFECKLLTAQAIARAGTAKLNALLSAAPTRLSGKAMSLRRNHV
ncbi:hypothetical protein HL653_21990 [Sphingomonas sp. AP4-R1]|uniref:hypothetical protein n=1 Tax=Sphingomonas sp. AP4-R1 TaxID=2735134 RepID=UPI00149340E0|nr:hypothetical protein [Sphingomonas sp. AP4-R1]QJU60048.1 hypothetical protein HL653_21990 [Sphingomonas sp. AP4-R1]